MKKVETMLETVLLPRVCRNSSYLLSFVGENNSKVVLSFEKKIADLKKVSCSCGESIYMEHHRKFPLTNVRDIGFEYYYGKINIVYLSANKRGETLTTEDVQKFLVEFKKVVKCPVSIDNIFIYS